MPRNSQQPWGGFKRGGGSGEDGDSDDGGNSIVSSISSRGSAATDAPLPQSFDDRGAGGPFGGSSYKSLGGGSSNSNSGGGRRSADHSFGTSAKDYNRSKDLVLGDVFSEGPSAGGLLGGPTAGGGAGGLNLLGGGNAMNSSLDHLTLGGATAVSAFPSLMGGSTNNNGGGFQPLVFGAQTNNTNTANTVNDLLDIGAVSALGLSADGVPNLLSPPPGGGQQRSGDVHNNNINTNANKNMAANGGVISNVGHAGGSPLLLNATFAGAGAGRQQAGSTYAPTNASLPTSPPPPTASLPSASSAKATGTTLFSSGGTGAVMTPSLPLPPTARDQLIQQPQTPPSTMRGRPPIAPHPHNQPYSNTTWINNPSFQEIPSTSSSGGMATTYIHEPFAEDERARKKRERAERKAAEKIREKEERSSRHKDGDRDASSSGNRRKSKHRSRGGRKRGSDDDTTGDSNKDDNTSTKSHHGDGDSHHNLLRLADSSRLYEQPRLTYSVLGGGGGGNSNSNATTSFVVSSPRKASQQQPSFDAMSMSNAGRYQRGGGAAASVSGMNSIYDFAGGGLSSARSAGGFGGIGSARSENTPGRSRSIQWEGGSQANYGNNRYGGSSVSQSQSAAGLGSYRGGPLSTMSNSPRKRRNSIANAANLVTIESANGGVGAGGVGSVCPFGHLDTINTLPLGGGGGAHPNISSGASVGGGIGAYQRGGGGVGSARGVSPMRSLNPLDQQAAAASASEAGVSVGRGGRTLTPTRRATSIPDLSSLAVGTFPGSGSSASLRHHHQHQQHSSSRRGTTKIDGVEVTYAGMGAGSVNASQSGGPSGVAASVSQTNRDSSVSHQYIRQHRAEITPATVTTAASAAVAADEARAAEERTREATATLGSATKHYAKSFADKVVSFFYVADDEEDVMERRGRDAGRQYSDGYHLVPWDQRSTIPIDDDNSDSCSCWISPRFWERIDWALRCTAICVVPTSVLTLVGGEVNGRPFVLPGATIVMALWVSQPTLGRGLKELYLALKGGVPAFALCMIMVAISPRNQWFWLGLFCAAAFFVALLSDEIKKPCLFFVACGFALFLQHVDITYTMMVDFYVDLLIGLAFGCCSFFIWRINWALTRAKNHVVVLGNTAAVSISGICSSFWTESRLDRELNLVRIRQLKHTSARALAVIEVQLADASYEPHSPLKMAKVRARRDLLKQVMGVINSASNFIEVIAENPQWIATDSCSQMGDLIAGELAIYGSAMDTYLLRICDFEKPVRLKRDDASAAAIPVPAPELEGIGIEIAPPLPGVDKGAFIAAKEKFAQAVELARQQVMLENGAYKPSQSDIMLGFFLCSVEQLGEILLKFEEPTAKNVHSWVRRLVYMPINDFWDAASKLQASFSMVLRGTIPRDIKESLKLALAMGLSSLIEIGTNTMDPMSGASLIPWVYAHDGQGTYNLMLMRVLGTVIGSIVAFMGAELVEQSVVGVILLIALFTLCGAFVQTSREFSPAGNAFIWGVVSIAAKFNLREIAINRFTANVIAVLVYFIVSFVIWPNRMSSNIKEHLQRSLKAFRQATLLIVKGIDETPGRSRFEVKKRVPVLPTFEAGLGYGGDAFNGGVFAAKRVPSELVRIGKGEDDENDNDKKARNREMNTRKNKKSGKASGLVPIGATVLPSPRDANATKTNSKKGLSSNVDNDNDNDGKHLPKRGAQLEYGSDGIVTFDGDDNDLDREMTAIHQASTTENHGSFPNIRKRFGIVGTQKVKVPDATRTASTLSQNNGNASTSVDSPSFVKNKGNLAVPPSSATSEDEDGSGNIRHRMRPPPLNAPPPPPGLNNPYHNIYQPQQEHFQTTSYFFATDSLPSAQLVLMDSHAELDEFGLCISQQETSIPSCVKEPTLTTSDFPEEQWDKLVRSQKNLYHLLSLLRFSFESFARSHVIGDAESIHWGLLSVMREAAVDIANMIFASIDLHLLMLEKVTTVPTHFLVRLRGALVARQIQMEDLFLEKLSDLLQGHDAGEVFVDNAAPFMIEGAPPTPQPIVGLGEGGDGSYYYGGGGAAASGYTDDAATGGVGFGGVGLPKPLFPTAAAASTSIKGAPTEPEAAAVDRSSNAPFGDAEKKIEKMKTHEENESDGGEHQPPLATARPMSSPETKSPLADSTRTTVVPSSVRNEDLENGSAAVAVKMADEQRNEPTHQPPTHPDAVETEDRAFPPPTAHAFDSHDPTSTLEGTPTPLKQWRLPKKRGERISATSSQTSSRSQSQPSSTAPTGTTGNIAGFNNTMSVFNNNLSFLGGGGGLASSSANPATGATERIRRVGGVTVVTVEPTSASQHVVVPPSSILGPDGIPLDTTVRVQVVSSMSAAAAPPAGAGAGGPLGNSSCGAGGGALGEGAPTGTSAEASSAALRALNDARIAQMKGARGRLEHDAATRRMAEQKGAVEAAALVSGNGGAPTDTVATITRKAQLQQGREAWQLAQIQKERERQTRQALVAAAFISQNQQVAGGGGGAAPSVLGGAAPSPAGTATEQAQPTAHPPPAISNASMFTSALTAASAAGGGLFSNQSFDPSSFFNKTMVQSALYNAQMLNLNGTLNGVGGGGGGMSNESFFPSAFNNNASFIGTSAGAGPTPSHAATGTVPGAPTASATGGVGTGVNLAGDRAPVVVAQAPITQIDESDVAKIMDGAEVITVPAAAAAAGGGSLFDPLEGGSVSAGAAASGIGTNAANSVLAISPATDATGATAVKNVAIAGNNGGGSKTTAMANTLRNQKQTQESNVYQLMADQLGIAPGLLMKRLAEAKRILTLGGTSTPAASVGIGGGNTTSAGSPHVPPAATAAASAAGDGVIGHNSFLTPPFSNTSMVTGGLTPLSATTGLDVSKRPALTENVLSTLPCGGPTVPTVVDDATMQGEQVTTDPVTARLEALGDEVLGKAIKVLVLSNGAIHSIEAFIFGIHALIQELGELEKALLETHHVEEINETL